MKNLEWNPSSEVTMQDIAGAKEIDVSELDKPFETEELTETRELSAEQKQEIMEDTGWSSEIVDCIGSIQEYEVYKEAVFDRLPTTELLSEDENGSIFEAELYGRGIMMWLLSQGRNIEVLGPEAFREKMKEEIRAMLGRYEQE